MYGLAAIKGLIKRGARTYGLAAVATAALIFLSVLPATAQARGNTYRGLTAVVAGTLAKPVGSTVTFTYVVTNPGFIGLALGQTLRLNLVLQDGSVRPVSAQVRVSYNGKTILIRNHEPNPTARVHSFDISRNDLAVAGEPGTARVQLWVAVEIVLSFPTRAQAEDPAAVFYPPTFELMDESGKTVVLGLLLPAVQKVKDKDGR